MPNTPGKYFALIWAFALLPASTQAGVIRIAIEPNSQNVSRPQIDGVYDLSAIDGVLNLDLGVAILLNPTAPIPESGPAEFGLHQNDSAQPYSAPFVPNAVGSTVTYFFDIPTTVTGVEIIQHINGVARISGALGDTIGSLTSLGEATGPGIPLDFSDHFFSFGTSSAPGTIFQLRIEQSWHPSAVAVYRTYLLDENTARIPAAGSEAPEPSTITMFCCLLAGPMIRRLYRSGRSFGASTGD